MLTNNNVCSETEMFEQWQLLRMSPRNTIMLFSEGKTKDQIIHQTKSLSLLQKDFLRSSQSLQIPLLIVSSLSLSFSVSIYL